MPRMRLLIAASLSAVAIAQVTSVGPASAGHKPPPTPASEPEDPSAATTLSGQAMVGVKANDKSRAREAIASYGGQVVSYYEPGDFYVVATPSNASDWSRSVERDARVRFAEADAIVEADATPTDPRYGELWGMSKIGMPLAWDQHTGSTQVVVGVVDTGVARTHEDLAAQMWQNPDEVAGNGIDDDANGTVDDINGRDCHNNDGNPADDNDHGTHVAGTIGAAANNSVGVAGVSWNVRIMSLKFLSSSGSGYTSNAIECIDYAIGEGADILNNSWGGGSFSQALMDAVGRSRTAGQLFVAAAGNSSRNNDSYAHYPSSYAVDNVVAVAATTSTDSLASFSNYGATSVDIAAPGSSILSTLRSGYGLKSGTSMATPHVAGAAALLLAQDSDRSYSDLKNRLYDTATKVSGLTGKVATGARLNVGAALTPEVADPPIEPTPTPTDTSSPTPSPSESTPVDAPPSVQLTSPTASTVQGVVGLAASASDDLGVAQVQFWVDGVTAGTDADGSNGWSFAWNTTGITGTHALTAVATDSGGQSVTSSPRSVTVNNSVVHVGDLDNTSYWYRVNKYWRGRIVVSVHDAFHRAVSGATVYGTFSAGWSGTRSCTTGTAGTCTLTTSNISKNVASTTLSVTSVASSGRTYTAAYNHDPESDSNGTVILARKPL